MGTGRIRAALQAIDTELKMCELSVVGWSHFYDTPLKKKKRQLKAHTKGLIHHDRIITWSDRK